MSPSLPRLQPIPATLRGTIAILAFCIAANLAPSNCRAQSSQDDHYCTVSAGGGWLAIPGSQSNSLKPGWNFQAGAGVAPGKAHRFYLTFNFMYGQSAIKQTAIQQAAILNPTDIGLLEATSGRAKFYTATFDPTYRIPLGGSATFYIFGGFGWLRRNLEFTGVSGEGALLQPVSPVVFGNGGNSGAYDAGAGVNFNLRGGLKLYAEARVVHGLGINGASTLAPLSAGIRW